MLAMYLAVLDDRSSEEQFIDVYNRIVSLLNKSILFNFYELSYIDIGDKRAGIFI